MSWMHAQTTFPLLELLSKPKRNHLKVGGEMHYTDTSVQTLGPCSLNLGSFEIGGWELGACQFFSFFLYEFEIMIFCSWFFTSNFVLIKMTFKKLWLNMYEDQQRNKIFIVYPSFLVRCINKRKVVSFISRKSNCQGRINNS